MVYSCDPIVISTHQPIEIIDVTSLVQSRFEQSRISQGQVVLFSPHTTAFICLNEKEQMLQQDMLDFLAGMVPATVDYRHNRDPVDGRLNAHSHLIGLFMNASETIPVLDGTLLLGGWQSIFFVELDGPREERRLHVQIIGAR